MQWTKKSIVAIDVNHAECPAHTIKILNSSICSYFFLGNNMKAEEERKEIAQYMTVIASEEHSV